MKRDDMMRAIRDGVYDAFMSCMTATGGYPITCEDIYNTIKEGVRLAVENHLSEHPINVEVTVEKE